MMSMVKNADLHPIPFLAIHTLCLPADMIIHSRCCHQICLVSRINEHLRNELLAAKHVDLRNSRPTLQNTTRAIQPFITINRNL